MNILHFEHFFKLEQFSNFRKLFLIRKIKQEKKKHSKIKQKGKEKRKTENPKNQQQTEKPIDVIWARPMHRRGCAARCIGFCHIGFATSRSCLRAVVRLSVVVSMVHLGL
jgi:hypothetical protein